MKAEVYYTIVNRDTNKPLGFGGKLDRVKAISILNSRIKDDEGKPFAKSEHVVTCWFGNGEDNDEIEYQVSADEFLEVVVR